MSREIGGNIIHPRTPCVGSACNDVDNRRTAQERQRVLTARRASRVFFHPITARRPESFFDPGGATRIGRPTLMTTSPGLTENADVVRSPTPGCDRTTRSAARDCSTTRWLAIATASRHSMEFLVPTAFRNITSAAQFRTPLFSSPCGEFGCWRLSHAATAKGRAAAPMRRALKRSANSAARPIPNSLLELWRQAMRVGDRFERHHPLAGIQPVSQMSVFAHAPSPAPACVARGPGSSASLLFQGPINLLLLGKVQSCDGFKAKEHALKLIALGFIWAVIGKLPAQR
jgi:hypothetical protein